MIVMAALHTWRALTLFAMIRNVPKNSTFHSAVPARSSAPASKRLSNTANEKQLVLLRIFSKVFLFCTQLECWAGCTNKRRKNTIAALMMNWAATDDPACSDWSKVPESFEDSEGDPV